MIVYRPSIFSSVVFLLLFINTTVLLSQNITLAGEIYSKSNYPLVGATISIDENRGTTTNEEGQFKLSIPSEKQEVNLQIRMLGFEPLDTIVKVQKNIYLQIKLQEKVYEQVEIVVQESKNSALDVQPWTILDIKSLGDLVSYNIADLLKFRNFGKKSLTELEELVADKNLSFGMDVAKYKLEED